MKSPKLFFLASALFVLAFLCQTISADLISFNTEKEFDETINSPENQKTLFFIKFYAPWCGHCRALAPVFMAYAAPESSTEFVKKYADKNELKIAEVDCENSELKGVCRKFNVAGFPTLFAVFQGKVLAEFQARRDADSFDRFLAPFLDIEERKKLFLEREKPATPTETAPQAPFVEVIKKLFTPFDGVLEDGRINDENFEQLTTIPKTKTVILFHALWCPHCKQFFPVMQRIASEFKGSTNIRFFSINVNDKKCAQIVEKFNVKGIPQLTIIKDDKIYPFEGPRDEESVKKFVTLGYNSNEKILPKPRMGAANNPFFKPLTLSEKMMQVIVYIASHPFYFVIFFIILLLLCVGVMIGIVFLFDYFFLEEGSEKNKKNKTSENDDKKYSFNGKVDEDSDDEDIEMQEKKNLIPSNSGEKNVPTTNVDEMNLVNREKIIVTKKKEEKSE